MSPTACAVDASVGVKWFRDEAGSAAARSILARHVRGEVIIAVDTLFLYEVLRTVSRERGAAEPRNVWRDLEAMRLAVVPLGSELVEAAAAARSTYGCSLYDAFPAALSDLLDAPLYSADRKAHARCPRVEWVMGE